MRALSELWKDFSEYLKVDVEVGHNESMGGTLPAVIKFTVTNTGTPQEEQPEIIFDEVQLKVGVPPDWFIEKAVNLTAGNSFTFQHQCGYDEIMQLQWSIEGKISPESLLRFRCRSSSIARQNQFPVNAYFNFLEHLNIREWLENDIKALTAPTPDTTLSEMKDKEKAIQAIAKNATNAEKRLQDFLSFVNYGKYREDVLKHRNSVNVNLKLIIQEIGKLQSVVKEQRIDRFEATRDRIIEKLSVQATILNQATEDLKIKIGLVQLPEEIPGDHSKSAVPIPIALREINLHENHTIEEAIPIVDKFLDACYRDNVRRVRIIHGKGIGVLRQAIRDYLGKHQLVSSP